jgi:cytochrome c
MSRTNAASLAGMIGLCAVVAAARALAAPASPPAFVMGDPAAGKTAYQACMGCHAIDDNDVGPKHRGVVGRAAGTAPGYSYSAALKASGIVWTPAMIDRWLQGPQKLVPGSKMFFSIPNPKQRADIIAYLATQK